MPGKTGRKSKLAATIAFLLALAIWLVRESRHEPALLPEGEWRMVLRVVDGDTLILDGEERVRLIGVDTPESVDPRRPVEAFGKEAAAFTRRLAEGKRVHLAYDQQRTDRYGRTLAYVYLEDGTFLNAEIIRQGYGHAYTRFPFAYAEQFLQLEREARAARRGLWAEQ
ncbi:MAG: thermonuclease family protein [Acidobacteriia bacterium]|jgi:micrococcal nuclease|nr:thermonuclease family protein [Terriglobia bacterium]